MSQYAQVVLFSGMVQMCGGSSSSSDTNSSDGFFSCSDYQIMLEVEVAIGEECSTDADCTQVLISGDETCEPNSILVNDDYDTSYFSSLYDEAIEAGCSITLDMNEDCAATEVACSRSTCTWQ